jgi:hypothetical protein
MSEDQKEAEEQDLEQEDYKLNRILIKAIPLAKSEDAAYMLQRLLMDVYGVGYDVGFKDGSRRSTEI